SDEVITNGFAQGGAQALRQFSVIGYWFRFFAIAKKRRDVAECCRRARSMFVDPHAAAGWQTADAAIKRVWIGDVTPEEKPDMPRGLGRIVDLSAGAQCFHLRGKPQGVAVVGVVEWFDAEWVARKKKPAFVAVPNGEGVHAAELIEHGFAARGVELEHDLCVAVGLEAATFADQFFAKLRVVVDFA